MLVDHQPLTNPHALVALVVLLTLLHELSWFTKSLTVPVTEGPFILPDERVRILSRLNFYILKHPPNDELISILLQPATHHLDTIETWTGIMSEYPGKYMLLSTCTLATTRAPGISFLGKSNIIISKKLLWL